MVQSDHRKVVVSYLLSLAIRIISSSDDDDDGAHDTFSIRMIEINIGIICICLPTLRPLLARIFPTYFTRSSDAASYPMHPPSGSNGRNRIFTKSAASQWDHVKSHTSTIMRDVESDSESKENIINKHPGNEEGSGGGGGITRSVEYAISYEPNRPHDHHNNGLHI